MSAVWEWCDEYNTWKPYSSVDTKSLEDAFQAGKNNCDVCNGGYRVTFDPKGMYQCNTYTKFVRRVRRIDSVPSTAPDTKSNSSTKSLPSTSSVSITPAASPTWQYIDPISNSWVSFDPLTTKMIEGLSKRTSIFTVNVPSCGGGFKISLAEMMITSSKDSNDKRKIQRNPPMASVSPVPSTSSSDTSSSSTTSNPSSSDSPKTIKKKSSKKSKQGSDGEDSLEALPSFQVNSELAEQCKKVTKWKSIASSDKILQNLDCVICCCPLSDSKSKVVHLSKCNNHYFHQNCIVGCFRQGYLTCPICSSIYGIRMGTQPAGKMTVTRSSSPLPGYPGHGMITINYHFPNGTQGPEHPSPGLPYYGTSRTAYLPDTSEGNKVLKLLQTAWDRRLVFTVGTSVTTGQSDCVVWNGIHHKTSTSGGATNFGYPDETYLERVTDELKAKGVE